MKDPYKILGVSKDADEGDIKKAYRKLALKFHPDTNQDNPDAEEKFKEIASAYEILGNPEKRNQYDTYGTINPQRHHQSGGFDISDIINQSFGDGFFNFGRGANLRGQNIRQTLAIDFMEAVKGAIKLITIGYPYKCESCNGTGAKNGTALEDCQTCLGQGKIGRGQGQFQIITTCPTCHGRGKIIKKPCIDCSAQGQKNKTEKINIPIPPGIEHGTSLRLIGKGMPSEHGMENGDLHVIIGINPHPKLKRDGNIIYAEESISYIDAILGTKILVDTAHGQVKLKIPPGTQPGDILKISGKGIIKPNVKGDHLVIAKIKMPEKISNQEKDLLIKLKNIAEEETGD